MKQTELAEYLINLKEPKMGNALEDHVSITNVPTSVGKQQKIVWLPGTESYWLNSQGKADCRVDLKISKLIVPFLLDWTSQNSDCTTRASAHYLTKRGDAGNDQSYDKFPLAHKNKTSRTHRWCAPSGVPGCEYSWSLEKQRIHRVKDIGRLDNKWKELGVVCWWTFPQGGRTSRVPQVLGRTTKTYWIIKINSR